MKKFIITLCILLSYVSIGFAQSNTTMTIGNVTASAGDTIIVPVNVTNFTNIGAISLKLNFDTAVLTYLDAVNSPSGVTFTDFANGSGVLSLGWFDVTSSLPINIVSGKLADLKFIYNGGSSNLTFNQPLCDISDESTNNVVVSYTNGSVTPLIGSVPTLTLGDVEAAPGSSISVPLTVETFTNIGAVSIKINYDPAVLTYTGISNAPANFTANAAAGVISIGWFDQSGTTPINIDSAKLLDLHFNYIGGTSALTFNTSLTEISDANANPVSAAFDNGQVSQSIGSGVLVDIPDVQAVPGSNILVPINVENFNNIGAVSLKINYNPSVVTFNGLQNNPSGFSANANAGVITVGWFDVTGANPLSLGSTKLLDLSFSYTSGSSNISFDTAQNEISDGSANPVFAVYNNGSVLPQAGSSITLTVGQAQGVIGGEILVPLNVENFNNIGAVSLKINYDPTVASFVGLENETSGFTANAANGVITVGWFDVSGTSPLTMGTAKLLDLKFTFLGGTSSLNFDTILSEVSDQSANSINVDYNNGNISAQPGSNVTLSLGDVTSLPGNVISVPMVVNNFNNIGAISLKINFDPTVMTFVNVENAPANVSFTANAVGGVLNVGWFDASGSNPLNVDSVKLLDLKFNYVNGRTDLNINTSLSEISNSSGDPIPVSFTNGSVGLFSGLVPALSVPNQVAIAGDNVSLPLMVQNFNGIGAVSLKIQYNAAVLTYKNLTNTPAGVTFTDNAALGVLTIGWFDPSGNNPLNIADGKLANLNFTFNGGNSPVTFKTSISELANSSGDIIGQVNYTNGSVMVNLPPSFSAEMPNVTVPEGDTLTFDYNATDPNLVANMTYSLIEAPAGSSIDPVTGVFKWIPNYNQAGSYNVTAQISDGVLNNISRTSIVTVINTNRAPVFTAELPDTTVKEAQTLAFAYQAADPDAGATLVYSLINSPAGASINSATGAFTWTPTYEQAGTFNITAVVTDGFLKDTSKVSVVVVTNRNRAPHFTAELSDTTVKEAQALSFTYQATDPDAGATLVYSLVNPPAGAAINPATGAFTWTPTYEQAGSFNITAVVSDGDLKDTSRASIVVVTNVNRAPQFTAEMPDVTVKEADTLRFAYAASDPDAGAVLTYSLVNPPAGASIDAANGKFTWVPTYEQSGSYTVTAVVSDGSLKDTSRASIVVVENVNLAPAFTVVPNDTLEVPENSLLSFEFKATDPDAGTVLKYSLTGAPQGAAIDTLTGVFTWTPAYTQSGNYDLTVVAKDGALSASVNVSIKVLEVNLPPVFTAELTDRTIAEGDTLKFAYQATDPDAGAILAYSLVGAPAGASISADGLFTWVPTFEQSGSYHIDAVVTDGSLTDTSHVNITVSGTNRAPVFTAIPADTLKVNEDALLTYEFKASDPDEGSVLKFSVVITPSGAKIDSLTGVFTWKPSFTQSGKYNATVSVTDGQLSAAVVVPIQVKNVNRAPVFTAVLKDDTIKVTSSGGPKPWKYTYETLQFQYKASDPDAGTKLTYALVTEPVAKGLIFYPQNGSFRWKPDTLAGNGVYKFYFTVSDGESSVTDTATILVPKATGVDDEELPMEYALMQNYPNPFNPSTKIKYSIPEDAKVTLTIYTLLGEKVAVLVNEEQTAGTHIAEFNASNLATGF